ncbi:hypothetical protein QT327_10385 [Olivibacter sp. 47]|uniref:hypothetical protein n=1 Tax=Olivibacter sp. 47 TaxID=3056486 RepID=UPI0025A46F5F|nr:hypothetical protein [Olivibacter sp. 47]MDM8174758.1 hypothetical protein [Olivibacter sp. 47]
MYKGNKKSSLFEKNKEITHYVGSDGLLYTSNGQLDRRVDVRDAMETYSRKMRDERKRFMIIVGVKFLAVLGMLLFLLVNHSRWN